MSKTETFKQLDRQPIENSYIELGQLTAELRHVNAETLHKLADVLNPVAKKFATLIEDATKSIAKMESTSRTIDEQIRSIKDDAAKAARMSIKSVNDDTAEITSMWIRKLEATSQKASEVLLAIREIHIKTRLSRLVETVGICVVAALVTMFLYMRFLN